MTKFKRDPVTDLSRLLQGEARLFTCGFVLKELRTLGLEDALRTAERTCGVMKAPKEVDDMSVDEGILKMVGHRNNKKYVVATQDVELRKRLRRVPGVPLVYMNRAVLVLEKQSDASLRFQSNVESTKRAPAKWERRIIQHKNTTDKSRRTEEGTRAAPVKKKQRKGPSGPNPLSAKRKKNVGASSAASSSTKSDHARRKKKRRRRRKRRNLKEETSAA